MTRFAQMSEEQHTDHWNIVGNYIKTAHYSASLSERLLSFSTALIAQAAAQNRSTGVYACAPSPSGDMLHFDEHLEAVGRNEHERGGGEYEWRHQPAWPIGGDTDGGCVGT